MNIKHTYVNSSDLPEQFKKTFFALVKYCEEYSISSMIHRDEILDMIDKNEDPTEFKALQNWMKEKKINSIYFGE